MYHKRPQNWKKNADFIFLDIVCLHIAFFLAYITRHGWSNPYKNNVYLSISLVYTYVDVAVLLLNNTMDGVVRRGHYQEFVKTVKHICLVELFVSFYIFSTQDGLLYSRLVIYLLAAYYLVISYIVREIWTDFLRKKYTSETTELYIVTTCDRVDSTVRTILSNNHGYHLMGICLLDKDEVGKTIAGVKVSSNRDTLLKYLCDKWVDEIYISLPAQYEYPREMIDGLVQMGITVHVELEDLPSLKWWNQTVEKIAGNRVLTVSMTMATTRQIILKRLLDIIGGLVGCFMTVIIAIIIGPMIYIKSPGPIFFTQTRVGRHGKKFKMYKFRSMYLDAEERKAELMKENRIKDGLMFKVKFDPRIIGCKKLSDGTVKKGIGNFIRDYSLDEFPQFFNVLKGELSLCGTRPPTVDEWEKYELHHRARLAIKPGITGLWQISGRSNITSFEQVVELDKKYIREWSLGLDIKILIKTVLVVLGRKGSM